MDELAIIERITKVEESTKSAHHRIDTMEAMQKEIRDLAMSVNTLAGSVKNLCDDMGAVTDRVKCIEEKPLKNIERIKGYVLSALIGGIVTLAVTLTIWAVTK